MNQPQRKYPKPSACPSPEDGPLALILWRLEQLEKKVDLMLPKLHQLTGAWGFAKLAGSFMLGAVAVTTFFLKFIV